MRRFARVKEAQRCETTKKEEKEQRLSGIQMQFIGYSHCKEKRKIVHMMIDELYIAKALINVINRCCFINTIFKSIPF